MSQFCKKKELKKNKKRKQVHWFSMKQYMPWVQGWDPNPKYVRQTSQNQYSCQHCGKRYRWKSTLKRHEVFECGGKEPAHQCPHCDYRAKQSGNLRVHIRKYHSSSSIVPFVPVHPSNNTTLDLHVEKKTADNMINNNN
ncbi:unnamed protein product [Bemisia tabaci]|uniref:C2H2-type domain-containing protein n=1 Tax=Bemisia tabaci TaxID=7038 RepID=A0A9P0EYK4_BEMTA|nr:unnamed protein product [Bemisia tabaci]